MHLLGGNTLIVVCAGLALQAEFSGVEILTCHDGAEARERTYGIPCFLFIISHPTKGAHRVSVIAERAAREA